MNSEQMTGVRMPVLFVGHGNPMNAITDNSYVSGWRDMVRDIPHPDAVLCVSAHWDARGVTVSTSSTPDTIHDFWGFPRELYEVIYPCPGSPDRSLEAARIVTMTKVMTNNERGLDHGAWAVLKWFYPDADVPVFQMSLDTSRPASFHYELGRQLAPLRERGILILGSGNMVHNLGVMDMTPGAPAYEWAAEFDELLKGLITKGRHDELIEYEAIGTRADLAVPTPEHYLPLVTVLGATVEGESPEFFNEEIDLRSVSMTSVKFG